MSHAERERLLPHDREAEQGVLGSIIHDNASLARLRGLLAADHFFLPAHREIYLAMLDLVGREQPIDEITLVNHLRARGHLESVGGAVYVAGLRDITPAASNATYYGQIVREKADLRALIAAAAGTAARAMEETSDVYGLIAEARDADAAAAAGTERTMADLFTVLDAQLKDDPETIARDVQVLTYTNLDSLIGQLAPGFVTTVAADTGMGKSVFAGQTALRNAQAGVPCAVFSLEMKPQLFVARMACAWGSVDSFKLLKHHGRAMSIPEWERFQDARAAIINLPVYWPRAMRGAPVARIEAEAAYYVHERGVKLLVVDHLRLMGHGKIYDRMSENSDRLATLAMHLDVPILSVVQINRAGSLAFAPGIHHMEGSGAIEQDSESIIILHGVPPDSDQDRSEMQGIVGKARDGKTGSRLLHFEPQYSRFDHGYWMERINERKQTKLQLDGA